MKNTICGAKTKTGEPCESTELFPNGRCRLHGGPSSGPRTKEGRERAQKNLKQSTEPPSRGMTDKQQHIPMEAVMNENTARQLQPNAPLGFQRREGVAKLAIISKWLQPNAPLGFQRREIMELSAELQAAIERTAAILRQASGKVRDLQGSIKSEYRREIGVDLGAMFDAELRHQLAGGDPLPGSFAAAMQADRPKRPNLSDKVAEALEKIDDMELEQRSARVRPPLACVPTKPTAEPGPLVEPDEIEETENLWS